MTGRRGVANPRVIGRDGALPLTPVSLDGDRIDEDWIRSLIDTYPDVLPIEQIGLRWGPLVSLGTDLDLGGVTISNLFVSPAGELTVAEPALWRNPPIRLRAVGRIIDIASALADLTFADLDASVVGEDSQTDRSIWARVQEAMPELAAEITESDFIDSVAQNLAAASVLLLVVGDGIRFDFEEIASVVDGHPHLGFRLELVELRAFHWSESSAWVQEDRLVVVPQLVGRTSEVIRTVDVAPSKPGNKPAVVDVRDAKVSRAQKPTKGEARPASVNLNDPS